MFGSNTFEGPLLLLLPAALAVSVLNGILQNYNKVYRFEKWITLKFLTSFLNQFDEYKLWLSLKMYIILNLKLNIHRSEKFLSYENQF